MTIWGNPNIHATSRISVQAYELAHKPKRIEVMDSKAGHELDEVADDIYVQIKYWILKHLA